MEEQVTYYALITEGRTVSMPAGIARRRIVGDRRHEEVFTRNLKWEPTQYFQEYRLGHNEVDHVEISEAEANDFIEYITEKIRNNPDLQM